ncbi:hypothetical protein T05_784 [Trichinella murrelli]|uniref:Uncharacterized protein n=1 Tax=Trichinella murrelli TaxID=144512 RepID=A0A0V0U744_9BILA|nr:hypothetical protein T05_784 [Trichinella murrelli]
MLKVSKPTKYIHISNNVKPVISLVSERDNRAIIHETIGFKKLQKYNYISNSTYHKENKLW